MDKKKVLEKLKSDENYYGDFGKQFLSNSDIRTLLTNPLALGIQSKPSPAFLVGGYFHTAILEPDKLKKYKVIESSTRNTKGYQGAKSVWKIIILGRDQTLPQVGNATTQAVGLISSNVQ